MNDERPIEKLLRRYADKRRAESGAPPELHPATRRLLQGEVARQYPPVRPARPGGFLAVLRARWVYAAVCLVVVGVGITLLRVPQPGITPFADNDKELSLAKAASSEPEALTPDARAEPTPYKLKAPVADAAPPAVPFAPEKDAASPAAVAVADRLSFTDSNVRRTAEAQPVTRSVSAPAGERYGLAPARSSETTPRTEESSALALPPQALATAPAPTPAENRSNPAALARTFATTGAGQDLAVAAAPPVTQPPAATSPRLAASDVRTPTVTLAHGGAFERAQPPTLAQSFANLASPAETERARLSPAANVLANFRVEQSGNQLRVIDGDGSTYLGVISTPTAESKEAVAKFSRPSQTSPTSSYRATGVAPAGGPYLYRVEGTNRTLQQSVSFAWNFVAPTNPPDAATQAARSTTPSGVSPAGTNALINGRVQIHTGAAFELNATPVKP